jgi:hypothetical protein
VGQRDDGALRGRSYCQGLWISGFQATSDPAVSGSAFDVSGVMSMGPFEQFALVEHRACTDEGDQVGDFGGQVNLDTAGGLFDIIVRELKADRYLTKVSTRFLRGIHLSKSDAFIWAKVKVRSRKGPFIESHQIVAAGAAVIWSPITRRIMYFVNSQLGF